MPSPTNARPGPGVRLKNDDLGLVVETDAKHVLVGASRGGFEVSYKKSPVFPQLVLESEWLTSGVKNSPRLAHFRARAWRLANDVANELGWFSGT